MKRIVTNGIRYDKLSWERSPVNSDRAKENLKKVSQHLYDGYFPFGCAYLKQKLAQSESGKNLKGSTKDKFLCYDNSRILLNK